MDQLTCALYHWYDYREANTALNIKLKILFSNAVRSNGIGGATAVGARAFCSTCSATAVQRDERGLYFRPSYTKIPMTVLLGYISPGAFIENGATESVTLIPSSYHADLKLDSVFS